MEVQTLPHAGCQARSDADGWNEPEAACQEERTEGQVLGRSGQPTYADKLVAASQKVFCLAHLLSHWSEIVESNSIRRPT